MRFRRNRWLAGCAALVIGGAIPAFAFPPEKDETRETVGPASEGTHEQKGGRAAASQTDQKSAASQDAAELDPDGNGTDAGDEVLRAERADQAASRKLAKQESKAGKMPAGFERLGLSDREQAEVLRVIAQYDRQSEQLLDRFEALHAEAIGVEAIALAEASRRNGGSILTADDQNQQPGDRQHGDQSQKRTAGFRPGDADQSRDDAPEHADAAKARGEAHAHANTGTGDKPAEEIKEIGQSSPFAGPSAAIWKRLHQLHLEAVKVEAQKLAAVEKLLTPEQLQQLHQFRHESQASQQQSPSASGEDRPDRPDLQNADQNAEEERRDRQADRQKGASGTENGQNDPNRPQKQGGGAGQE